MFKQVAWVMRHMCMGRAIANTPDAEKMLSAEYATARTTCSGRVLSLFMGPTPISVLCPGDSSPAQGAAVGLPASDS